MATFDYASLKEAWSRGMDVGHFNGYPVYPIKTSEMYDKGTGAYYILFDQDNLLVRKMDGDWYKFAKVDMRGSLSDERKELYREYMRKSAQRYDEPVTEMKKPVEKRKEAETAYEKVEGDVQLGLAIDDILAGVRTLTVDDLLKGFNYGL